MKNLNHYLEFRKEIDKICVPEILKCVSTLPIYQNGKQVGIFCYAIQPEHIYIDCVYIEPDSRRKGLAKDVVLGFYEKRKHEEIRLHIINQNKVAYDFWNSLFDLKPIDGNYVDTLYQIKALKGEKK